MKSFFLNDRKKSHRAVSQIIGSLFMLAIVAVVGSVIFFQGLAGITSFQTFLAVFDQEGNTPSTYENLIIEHVRFYTDNDAVAIWLRNTGDNEIGIDVISMVRIETQELIIQKTDITKTVFGKELQVINVTGTTLPNTCSDWDCDDASAKNLKNSKYRVSVTTSRGNSFETVAEPFNS